MKTIVFVFAFCASVSFGQVYTSVQDGDFWSPLTWDCTCFPADGDSLVLNHNISLSTGIAYNSGQIYISPTGTLNQGANNFSFYINGGSMINYGSLTIDNLLLDAGFIENYGTANLDSVWTRSTTTNTGTIFTDAFAHDENATFTNSGNLDVTNNFANQGVFINSGIMTVSGNASNCNIQASDATFDCDGFLCIAGNFINCATDTLRGDGTIYIGGTSSNDGEVEGNLLIHTPTGGFNLNLGNIAGTVTYGTDGCAAGVEEEDLQWMIFPNPAISVINSSVQNVKYFVYDLSGRLVLSGVSFNGVIYVESLNEGNYVIKLENEAGITSNKTFIKL